MRLQDPKLDAPSQFILFTEIDIQTFLCDFEDPLRGIICNTIDYHPGQQALVIKMKTGAHEAAHVALNTLLIVKLTGMGHAYRGLDKPGQKSVSSPSRRKDADLSYRPKRLPQGRSKQWPTLVAESGYLDSQAILDNNAGWWLSASGGDVKIAVTIDIHKKRRDVYFKLYELLDDRILMCSTLGFQSTQATKPRRLTMALLSWHFTAYS